MMRLGALKWAICSRQKAISSAWLSTRPSFSFTKAQGTSPPLLRPAWRSPRPRPRPGGDRARPPPPGWRCSPRPEMMMSLDLSSNLHVAVLVPDRQIPASKPAVRHRLVTRRRVLEIALHDDVAAQEDLPRVLPSRGTGSPLTGLATRISPCNGEATPWRALSRESAVASCPCQLR